MPRLIPKTELPLQFALLAVLVGIAAGFGAVIFRALIALFHNLFFLKTLSVHYDANVHTPLGPWGAWIILGPVIGAAVVVFLVKNFAPEARGHGVPEVMGAIYYNRGVIRPVVALIKSLASALSIGSGGAIGREGPIIQIGSAFGSTLGQIIRMPQWQRLTLIACGAGGGIAATFNTPIGGLLFAIELIMPEVSARTLIPVAIATGAATFIGRSAFGDHPAFQIPALALGPAHLATASTLVAYLMFGLLLGLLSWIYIRAIYVFEAWFNRLPGNYYTRHMLGMAIVGVMMYLFMRYSGQYYVEGVGYATVQDILAKTLINPWFLLLLCVAKLLATSLTLGSGASGGVFSPCLFMGATLGGTYAAFLNQLLPGVGLDTASMAVIGMAGMVGGATGAVVTAVVMIFEMTRDYNIIIPLMITVSVTYGMRRLLIRDSIYTRKLTLRGQHIPDSLQTNLYLLHTASQALSRPAVCLDVEAGPRELKAYAERAPRPDLVLTSSGKPTGVVLGERVPHLRKLPDRPVGEAMQPYADDTFIVVDEREMLFDVVGRMRRSGAGAAVVARGGDDSSPVNVLGVLSWEDVSRNSRLPVSLLQNQHQSQSA